MEDNNDIILDGDNIFVDSNRVQWYGLCGYDYVEFDMDSEASAKMLFEALKHITYYSCN
jgi:hypothetical protein